MTHLLVTNDFPPKVGGIQSYLYELWRRIPPERFSVLTIDHPGAAAFDESCDMRIERVGVHMMLPTPRMRSTIRRAARDVGASLVVLDPVSPVGLLGPAIGVPYGVVVHGAELAVQARIPGLRRLVAKSLAGAELVVAAGRYPAAEVARLAVPKEVVTVPPGVDLERFHPLGTAERRAARGQFGIADDALLVVAVTRLVPRKGMDALVEASSRLRAEFPSLVVLIGGTGRDRARLEREISRARAPVRLLGHVPDATMAGLVGCADVAAMPCRNRWFGLEQEGFGIVFLEAAAAGVAAIAGASGGAADAVVDGVTGVVVDRPRDAGAVAAAIRSLLRDPERRQRFGAAARERAVQSGEYAVLAASLDAALARHEDAARP